MKLMRLAHRFLVAQTMPGWALAYYDRMISQVSDFYLGPLCAEVQAAFPGPARILDIGTGPGHLPLRLAHARPGYRITGIDLSGPSVALATAKAAPAGLDERLDFRCCDLTRVGTELGSFDLVLSSCSLHHWRWPAAMFQAARAHLAPEGEFWILDDSCEVSNAARREWVARVRAAAAVGGLFSRIFWFESRHLAYARPELAALAAAAGLELTSFELRDVFFLAKLRKSAQPSATDSTQMSD